MSSNSSFSSNDAHLHMNLSTTINNFFHMLFFSKQSIVTFMLYNTVNIIVLLPLSILILYLGLQKWRASTTTAAAMSHSDVFTYHQVVMGLVGMVGSIICCCGIYKHSFFMSGLGFCMSSLPWYGETFFHILTCMERYLAGLHPITYRSLRSRKGIRLRNICTGCVWLLSTAGSSLMITFKISLVVGIAFLIIAVVFVTFCSISVLFLLIRPRPGESGGKKGMVDPSKQRALHIIALILGVLLLRFSWNLIWFAFWAFEMTMNLESLMIGIWFNLPCSLMLPLLFLHREEMLACFRKKANPDHNKT